MKGLLARLTRSALDAVFPIHCLGCGREGKFLCGLCMAGMPRLTLPYCPVCARPGYRRLCDWCERSPVAVDGIRAPFLYVEGSLIQRAIVDFKLQRTHAMAPELARVLAEYLYSNPMPGDVIVPVPSHSRRLRSRGFNQAVLLGRELGKITGLPVNEGPDSTDQGYAIPATNGRSRRAMEQRRRQLLMYRRWQRTVGTSGR